MENVNKAIELAQSLLNEHDAYSKKPTKAASKRMRLALGELKKVVTSARAELVEADKVE